MAKRLIRRKEMVDKISIIVEGGVLPHKNIAEQSLVDTTKLEEGFYRLFGQAIPEKNLHIQVDIKMGSGRNKARDIFKERLNKKENTHLLIDLEGRKNKRTEQLEGLELVNEKDLVFFMVEKMEAWFLSQPDKIEKYCEDLLKNKQTLVADEIKKPADEIIHPDNVLKTILKRHSYEEKRGKQVKRRYKKLKDGAALLQLLDLEKLQDDFEDVKRLVEAIQNKIAQN